MSQSAPLSDEIALRIGLAARELPETDAARLLRVLDDAVGLPPGKEKLAALTVKDLKNAADGEFSDLEPAVLKSALAFLKGEQGVDAPDLPAIEAYQEGDLPGGIRVAVASNTGETLDGHFGSCRRFLIYQVSAEENRLIDIRPVDDAQAADDKNGYRASLIQDCQLLFIVSIGGPAAAKVVRAGAHPLKKPDGGPARDEIIALQQALGKNPAPWLAKVMGQTPEERIRFARELEEENP